MRVAKGFSATGLQGLTGCLVPIVCPGCGLDDVRVCEECSAPWWEAPFRSDGHAPRLEIAGRAALPVWSIARLEGATHLMVRAWKDGGRRDLDPFFAEALRREARAISPALPMVEGVVPVPSLPRSVRTRGVDLTALLSEAAMKGLRVGGRLVSMERLLLNRGGDSRSLATQARWRNASRGIHAAEVASRVAAVVLVDDVVTTGASLARAVEVLEGRGVAVVGGLTLAATPPPSGPRSHR